MKNELSLRQSLQQKLTLKQKLGLELLVKNELQIEEYLRQEMNVNPLLEPNGDSAESLPEEHEQFSGFDENWSNHYNSHERTNATIRRDHDTHDFLIQQYAGEHNWRKIFVDEISLSNYDEKKSALLTEMLEHVNEEGFMENISELQAAYELTDEEFETLRQEFCVIAPPGVGAYDEIESYKIQLRAKGVEEEEILQLLDTYRKPILEGNWELVFQKEQLDPHRETQLRHLFSTLSKHPGYAQEDAVQYIIPDIVVRRSHDGGFTVELNDKYDALFTLNTYYIQLIEGKSITKNDRTFLMTYYNRYKTMREALEKRRMTMTRLAEYLIEFQHDFFEYGPKWIKPLTRGKVAEELGFNASTIVRAVQNKYIQTEYGIFPLAVFFAQSISTKKNESAHNESQKHVSRLSVLDTLQDIVAKEDKNNPLTDEEIMDKLAQAGFVISRRAVNKYRGILKIPPRKERRI